MWMTQSRRDFVASLSLAGAAGLLGGHPALADEGPPETTTVRLPFDPAVCLAPIYIAGELLRAEGFTDVRYVPPPDFSVLHDQVDFDLQTGAWILSHLDAAEPITVISGIHVGCYELFANAPIATVTDLKGRRVGIPGIGHAGHLYVALMAAQVGLDPHTDIDWVESPNGNFMALLAEGEIDAFLAFAPEPQELRARKVGRMILSLGADKPWSQYFCCMLVGSRSFVRDHPVATKRFLRAILKASDICANEPELAARQLVDGGFTPVYDFALQTMVDLPYRVWRDYDPEDTLRFYALRLHEVGLVKSSPNQILARGTDWRFLDEIKRELKV
jgi:NitT/TauT family transport system substrate-binding protein